MTKSNTFKTSNFYNFYFIKKQTNLKFAMKKLLLIALLLFSNLIIAQSTTNLKVSESAEYKDKVKSNDILAIYTSNTGETVIARNSKKTLLFDVFDTNQEKMFNKNVEVSKKETYVGDLYFNNQLKLFTVYAPNKNDRILYCHILDLKTKSYKKVTVFETTVEKKQSLFGSSRRHNTSFAISPDGNYFAIATDNIKKNRNAYTIHVYDAETLKLEFKKSYQEDETNTFTHNDLFIENDKTVFSLGKLFTNGKRQKKLNGDANYQFILNKITPSAVSDIKISLEDDHIQSLSISVIENKLHLLGFYSEKNVNRVKGGCDFIIDTNNLTIANQKKNLLPKQVFDDLYSYRKANRKKKKQKELSNFEIDYILNDSQGNTYLIAEEFYVTQTYVQTGTAGGYWQTVFHYDDILILKFNTSGNLDWGRSIFKRATTPSYNAFLKNDQLHVILNSGKNLTEKNDGRTKVSKGWFESSALYDFEYAINGDVSYNKIQDNRGNEYYLPYFGTFETDKFIMMSDGRKKKTFMILE
ncbi:hypothetical protein CXF54_00265 [Olleya sp. 1-3]|nr:hypothetical protein CXF54_00265 [Olleya sp. 1-3]